MILKSGGGNYSVVCLRAQLLLMLLLTELSMCREHHTLTQPAQITGGDLVEISVSFPSL